MFGEEFRISGGNATLLRARNRMTRNTRWQLRAENGTDGRYKTGLGTAHVSQQCLSPQGRFYLPQNSVCCPHRHGDHYQIGIVDSLGNRSRCFINHPIFQSIGQITLALIRADHQGSQLVLLDGRCQRTANQSQTNNGNTLENRTDVTHGPIVPLLTPARESTPQ